jgi:hypothetical protein
MASIYIEPRPKGRPEGSPIEDYIAEDHADHVLVSFKTQHEAIEWAKGQGHAPHLARVRHQTTRKKAITGGRFKGTSLNFCAIPRQEHAHSRARIARQAAAP